MADSHPRLAELQYPVRPDRENPYLRLQSVVIFIRDFDRSLHFFVEQLGFSVVIDAKMAGSRWVAVAPPDGHALLALVAPAPGTEDAQLVGKSRQVIFITENVFAKYEEWLARGVNFSGAPSTPPWGGTFTTFQDPDGNTFSLFGFDKITRDIEARRRAIEQQQQDERRAAYELEIAKAVQARLFPQAQPPVRTLDYAGICIQARQVGGDYYDFLDLGPERLGLLVGDISGKGIAAALLMANLQANLRSQQALAADHPARFLRSVNRLFFDNTSDSAYATLFFADYDGAARRLRYASCGHLSALLLGSDGRLARLESTATVLGMFPDWDCEVPEVRLAPGDVLTLYTDGVTETFRGHDEEYGEPRLIEALRRHRDLAPRNLLAAIVDDVRAFSSEEQHDDITLIVARCKG